MKKKGSLNQFFTRKKVYPEADVDDISDQDLRVIDINQYLRPVPSVISNFNVFCDDQQKS